MKSNAKIRLLIEQNTEDNKRQKKQESTQVENILSEIFELRKETDFLKKKRSTRH